MKSQVNALLHVVHGILADVRATYPALEDDLSKDFGRLTLYSQTRGIGLYTLDLPSLEALLLQALECGRLKLFGPISSMVSSKIRVPRLFAGLWLRVFERDASLKQDVDVTALAFLRQLLVVGKKLELGYSDDRRNAVVGAYHDIERKLRGPSLNWCSDSLFTKAGDECDHGSYSGSAGKHSADDQHLHFGGGDRRSFDLFPCSLSQEDLIEINSALSDEVVQYPDLNHLHFVQASDRSYATLDYTLPLFRVGGASPDVELRARDIELLNKTQQIADLIVGSFDTFDPIRYSSDLEERGEGIGFRHGPGAVAERLKNWEKSQFPNWTHKLHSVFPFELCGRTAGSLDPRPLNHEVPSRLIAVPKTMKGPRLIAAEPTSHQWCQQVVLRFLFDQCKESFKGSFIDFKDQSKSSDMVMKASLDRSLATVDLSDASDRLTCWTVERLFRSNPSILAALHAARTRYLKDEISEVPSFLRLKKFASQGTATTFPVMSLTMLVLALGASLTQEVNWRNIWKLRNQVRVFGDDIIIPTHGYGRLMRLMELMELKINTAKSYVNGYFRESCGTDGFMGYDVTPVKPKVIVADSPASCQAVVDTSNNLFLKGYWNAATACIDLLPPRLRRGLRIVGRNDAGFRGLASYSGSYESHLKTRWNSRLHRYEVRTWGISPKSEERPRDGFSAFLDFVSRKHNPEQARVVSEYADIRKVRIDLQWEPSSPHASLPARTVRSGRDQQ